MTKEELDYIRSREAIGGYRGVERIRLKQLIAHIDELERAASFNYDEEMAMAKDLLKDGLIKECETHGVTCSITVWTQLRDRVVALEAQLRQAKQELREIAIYQGQDLTIPLHLQSLIMIIQSKAKSALAALERKDQ